MALAGSNGAKGAAVATLCGETVLALGTLVALVHGHPEYRPKFMIVLKVALAAAPAVVLALLSGVPSLIRVVLALAAYALVILVVRAVPAEVVELLPPRLRRG